MEGPEEGPRSAAEQAIHYLLSRNFLLTALELLQEAGEAGLGHEVESLIRFFKDPALFPPEEVAACNPEDGALFAQAAHQRQQQLSQAQYELALAREQLAAAAAAQPAAPPGEAAAWQQAPAGGVGPAPPDALLGATELHALHAAVLAHLQAHGFKVAALAFSKEAQLSPAVGVAAAGPPAGSLAGTYAAARQLEAQSLRLAELKAQAEQRGRELVEIQQELAASRGAEAAAAAEVEFLRGQLALLEQAQQAQQQREEHQAQQQAQQQRGEQHADQDKPAWPGQQDKPDAGSCEPAKPFAPAGAAGALAEVAACMPRVLPHLLINKREELVPALCALCQAHPQAAARRQLAGLLFGLIKRPNEAQRCMIAGACVTLARRIGPARAMLELVPHLQEQAQHELVERRLLVAEAAGALAPHLPPARAAPAVLQLLRTLLRDSQPQVRCQALCSLVRLTAALGGDTGSLGAVLELLFDAAADASGDVMQLLLQTALPAVLDWIGHSELLVAELLPQVLRRLLCALQQCPAAGGTVEASACGGDTCLRSVPANVQSQAATLLQIYTAVLPAVRELALRTQPAWVAQAALAAAAKQPPGEAELSLMTAPHSQDFGAASPSLPAAAASGNAATHSSQGSANSAGCLLGDTALRQHTVGSAGPPPAPSTAEPVCTARQRAGMTAAAASDRPGSAPAGSGRMQPGGPLAAPLARHGSGPPALAGQLAITSSGPPGSSPEAAVVQPPGAHLPADPRQLALGAGAACRPASGPAGGGGSGSGGAAPASGGAVQAPGTDPEGVCHLPAAQPELEQGVPSGATHQPAMAGRPGSGAARDPILEAAAFAAWVRASSGLEDWRAIDYVAVFGVPTLIKAALLVAPLPETALLRQRFVGAVKSTCLAFGEAFAGAVVVPQLHAAAGIPAWPAAAPPACPLTSPGPSPEGQAEVSQLHARLASRGLLAGPASPSQRVAGVAAALPLLLAGALPYAGASAAAACLRRLCTDGGSGSGEMWALQHPRAFVPAVRCAAGAHLVQVQLVPLMWELLASKQPGPRLASALLAGAAAPSLPQQQVTRQLLPLLSTLGGDPDAGVRRAAVAAAASLFGCLAPDPEAQEALMSTLDEMLVAGGHGAEMALLAVLAPAAPRANSQQLEWLLQGLLLMLAAMHERGSSGRTPAQLREAAATAFVSLRQIEAHEFTEQRLHMHFAAALTALQREADLLDQPQRDVLAAMVEDHEATVPAGTATSSGGDSGPGMLLQGPLWPAPAPPTSQPHAGGRGQPLLGALFAGAGLLSQQEDLPVSAFLGETTAA